MGIMAVVCVSHSIMLYDICLCDLYLYAVRCTLSLLWLWLWCYFCLPSIFVSSWLGLLGPTRYTYLHLDVPAGDGGRGPTNVDLAMTT